MYSNNEQIVLLHFFTNIDKNIYCATDNMPTSLWALLLGGYSRSSISLRDRLLQVFRDIASDNYDEYVDKLAKSISLNSLDLSNEIAKAEKFMAKWAVEYGHNSLKDSSYNRIAIEHVSIRASKILENSKLGAFQEKSTRYMDFSGDSLYLVDDNKINELNKKAVSLYAKVTSKLTEYYKNKIDKNNFKFENAWIKTCKAKAFDDARYLLPTAITTSLGVTMPSRETERWLSYLMSSHLTEVFEIAKEIKTECMKVTPSLISHVTVNPLLNRRFGTKLANNINVANVEYFDSLPGEDKAPGVTLNYHSNIDKEVAFSLVEAVGYYSISSLNKITTLDEIFELSLTRSKFDEMPQETAVGILNFDIICDIGAFRDIQRHRVGTQINEMWTSLRGYSTPDSFNDPELKDLKDEYDSIFNEYSSINKDLTLRYSNNSEYCLLLGHNTKLTYSCDFRQFVYFVELRSGEAGHYSYRRIAQDMYNIFNAIYPELGKYIRVNLEGDTNRKSQEEQIEIKKSKLRRN